jgi:putative membrane protein
VGEAMLWVKSIHVMAIVSWMAGLLYIYRLYVYHAMETEQVVRSRFEVMERRLLNAITTPAAIVSAITGTWMILLVPGFFAQPWLHAKLGLVGGLIWTHMFAIVVRKRLLTTPSRYKHTTFRFLNEVPTLLMIGIVILVIVKPMLWS